jgi:diguanylate cyclase (GGDEF)-like protein
MASALRLITHRQISLSCQMEIRPPFNHVGAVQALVGFTLLATLASLALTWFSLTLAGHSMSHLAWGLAAAVPLLLTPAIGYRVFTLLFRLQHMEERLHRVPEIDVVTETLSQANFLKRARICFNHGKKERVPVSVLILEIDPMREMNREHGAQVGNQVLRAVACACRGMMQPNDLLARYGGEGLALYMPNVDHAACRTFAESLRQRLAHTTVAHERLLLRLTVSVGSASSDREYYPETLHSLVAAAEAALTLARAGGTNRAEALPPQAVMRHVPRMAYSLSNESVGAGA